MLMRPKHSPDRLLTLKASDVHDLMGSIAAELRKKCVVNVWMPGARPSRELFISSLPPAALQSWV